MTREIVLDTETTGLDPRQGHRLIEIACIELEDYLPTGRSFHRYVHPERAIDPDAQRVHGISLDFLADKPRFSDIWADFVDFAGDAQLIAHNAPFDRGFINEELSRVGHPGFAEARWIDTLQLAQKRFPGMYNSLDALCKRFKISLADRTLHGALIDTRLLAGVYLELRGGNVRGLDFATPAREEAAAVTVIAAYGPRPRPLGSLCTEEEAARHAAFVRDALGEKALWATMSAEPQAQ